MLVKLREIFLLQAVELRQLPLRESLGLRLKVAADHGQGVFQHLQPCRGQRHRNFAPVQAAGGALNQPLAAQLIGQARDVGGFLASRIAQLRGSERVVLGAIQHHQQVEFRVGQALRQQDGIGAVVKALGNQSGGPNDQGNLLRVGRITLANQRQAAFMAGAVIFFRWTGKCHKYYTGEIFMSVIPAEKKRVLIIPFRRLGRVASRVGRASAEGVFPLYFNGESF